MSKAAKMTAPATQVYRGAITDPERWSIWTPREGDIVICTPPKCGTTWTQAIVSMLVHGGAQLPEKLPVLSPWVDADLGVAADEVSAALAAQKGRRVVKTHTPVDGFPAWDGVTVIAVYRHPLDVFFSLRKHAENKASAGNEDPMRLPMAHSFRAFVEGDADARDFDRDTLATLVLHYSKSMMSDRRPAPTLFHYSDMLQHSRRTVERLAAAAGIAADSAVIDRVAEATNFAAMKANAATYAPASGTGFWKSETAFFDSATSNKWNGQLSAPELKQYDDRLAALITDSAARRWLENGDGR